MCVFSCVSMHIYTVFPSSSSYSEWWGGPGEQSRKRQHRWYHSQTSWWGHTACIYTFLLLVSQVASLFLPPPYKHIHTYSYVSYLHAYICDPIALTLFMLLHLLTHTDIIYRPLLLISLFLPLPLTYTHKHAHTNHTSSCLVSCDPRPSLHFPSSESKVDTGVQHDLGCLAFCVWSQWSAWSWTSVPGWWASSTPRRRSMWVDSVNTYRTHNGHTLDSEYDFSLLCLLYCIF